MVPRGKFRMRAFAVFAGLCVGLSVASAQGFEAVSGDGQDKLEDALDRLRELRRTIRDERIPLEKNLNRLDARASELEETLERARRLRDSRAVEMEALRSRVEARESEIDFIMRTLVPEYVADYDASLSPGLRGSEGPGERIRSFNRLVDDSGASEEAKLDGALDVIGDSFEQLRKSIGGRHFSGEALGPDQRVREGRFLQVGPLSYFATPDGTLTGMIRETNALEPEVYPLDGDRSGAIARAVREGEGTLPVDPTLGDALEVDATRGSLLEHFDKGGVWVYPILFFAFVSAVIAIVKGVQVFGVRHPESMAIHGIVKHLRAGEYEAARKLAAAQPEPGRGMLLAAVDHADESIEMVEEVMYESMLSVQPRYESFLNVIAVTAAAAPLLGLLGTVTGIIKTFRLMTVFGSGDPEPLISGISEALITTELGLVLAIPALILHALLSRRVAGIMARMEKSAVTFVNGLSRRRDGRQEAGGPTETAANETG